MDEVKTNDVSIQHYDFEVIADDRRAPKLGLVTLETDLTIEDELRFFFAGPPTGVPQVVCHFCTAAFPVTIR